MLDFTKFIEFINSNGLQTLLLFVAGLSIFILYKLQKNDKRKNVATMIVLEIDEIRKNIDVLKPNTVFNIPAIPKPTITAVCWVSKNSPLAWGKSFSLTSDGSDADSAGT